MFDVFGNSLFTDLNRLRREMDALFQAPQPRSGIRAAQNAFGPAISIGETHEDVRVYAFAPGLDKDSIDVTIQGNRLRIAGRVADPFESRTGKDAVHPPRTRDRVTVHRGERAKGAFSKLVTLPESVDPQQVHATYENGVLMVVTAKKPDVKPQRIAIK